jgi:hypothetical protein
LTYYWRWGPQDAWNLTGTQLMWWLDQLNRIRLRDRTPDDS